MGWDLIPVSRIKPMHISMYWWLHGVSNALEHLGADMDLFAYSNGGDCVPADVARAWADTLEEGMGDLKLAVVHYSGDPPLAPGDAEFVVHRSYTEEQAMEDFKREVLWVEGQALTFVRFKDLYGSSKESFDRLIEFLRRSRGFHQC